MCTSLFRLNKFKATYLCRAHSSISQCLTGSMVPWSCTDHQRTASLCSWDSVFSTSSLRWFAHGVSRALRTPSLLTAGQQLCTLTASRSLPTASLLPSLILLRRPFCTPCRLVPQSCLLGYVCLRTRNPAYKQRCGLRSVFVCPDPASWFTSLGGPAPLTRSIGVCPDLASLWL